MTEPVSEPISLPVAETATDCGATGEDAGWAVGMFTAPAPLLNAVGTTEFTLVLEVTVPVVDVGIPEVSSPEGELSLRSVEGVLIVSTVTGVNEFSTEVTARVSPVVVVTTSSLVLDLVFVSVGGATVEEPVSVVVTGGLSRAPVSVVTALTRVSDSDLDVVVSSVVTIGDDKPVVKVVVEEASPPSDDELEGCSVLLDVCEPEALKPCPLALETEDSDAMLLDVGGAMTNAFCGFSSEFAKVALEGDALDSGCAVEPSGEEVTPLSSCSTVDEPVACGTASFPLG